MKLLKERLEFERKKKKGYQRIKEGEKIEEIQRPLIGSVENV